MARGSSMSRIANWFLNRAKSFANSRGSKLAIEIDENAINYKFEKVKKDEKRTWENFYANAGIFVKNHVEEVKINAADLRNEKFKITEKAQLEPVFKANLAKSLWGFAQQDNRQEQLQYIIIAGLGIVVFMMMM